MPTLDNDREWQSKRQPDDTDAEARLRFMAEALADPLMVPVLLATADVIRTHGKPDEGSLAHAVLALADSVWNDALSNMDTVTAALLNATIQLRNTQLHATG